MEEDASIEVFRAVLDAEIRYAYFLLAAAGAGIGLAASQTQTTPLAWSQVPLGLAVSSWLLSFFFGCRHLLFSIAALRANFTLLRVTAGKHPDIQNEVVRVAAVAPMRREMEKHGKRSNRFAHWQF
jgi:hypothetical protein